MKNTIIILCLLVLFSCHKDSSPPPKQANNNQNNRLDTSTFFLAANGSWTVEKSWPGIHDSSINRTGIDAFFSADSLPIVYNDSIFYDDSVILYVFNKGWKRMPVYDNSISEIFGIGKEYITIYPFDTLIYIPDGCPCGGMPLWNMTSNNRLFVQLMYQTTCYNSLSTPNIPYDNNIQLKIFIKPKTSNIQAQ